MHLFQVSLSQPVPFPSHSSQKTLCDICGSKGSSALMECRPITLDKFPGVRPIWIYEMARGMDYNAMNHKRIQLKVTPTQINQCM